MWLAYGSLTFRWDERGSVDVPRAHKPGDKKTKRDPTQVSESEMGAERQAVISTSEKPDNVKEIGRNFETKARVILAIATPADINLSHLPHTMPFVFPLFIPGHGEQLENKRSTNRIERRPQTEPATRDGPEPKKIEMKTTTANKSTVQASIRNVYVE